MSDDRLRGLERAWRATGDVEAEVEYLREGLRLGAWSVDWLRFQAYCGRDAAALVEGRHPARELRHVAAYRQWERGLKRFGDRALLRAYLAVYEEVVLPLRTASREPTRIAAALAEARVLREQLERALQDPRWAPRDSALAQRVVERPLLQLQALPGEWKLKHRVACAALLADRSLP
ncbi:MAG: hypothetical protein R3F62_23155 [Planctomycetota bacterium]